MKIQKSFEIGAAGVLILIMDELDKAIKRIEFNRDLIKGDEEREPAPKGLVSKLDRTKKLINRVKNFPTDKEGLVSILTESKELSLKQFTDEIITALLENQLSMQEI